MSIKEQLSKLPEDVLKKQILKLILKDVDVSDEKFQNLLRSTLLRSNQSSMLQTKQ